jgi:hypothetical protein
MALYLLDSPPADDTLIKDSFKHVRDRLAQVPEGKTGALVLAVDYKFGVLPTFSAGLAHRTAKGWEIAGEAFINKAGKGARVTAVKTW